MLVHIIMWLDNGHYRHFVRAFLIFCYAKKKSYLEFPVHRDPLSGDGSHLSAVRTRGQNLWNVLHCKEILPNCILLKALLNLMNGFRVQVILPETLSSYRHNV